MIGEEDDYEDDNQMVAEEIQQEMEYEEMEDQAEM